MISAAKKDGYFSARVAPDFKENLKTLAELVSQTVGTKVSMVQALEVAVREAIEARKNAVSKAG